VQAHPRMHAFVLFDEGQGANLGWQITSLTQHEKVHLGMCLHLLRLACVFILRTKYVRMHARM
jgi:hypothetical protein